MQLATHTGDSALRPELETRGNMGSMGWLVLGSGWVAVAVVLRSAPNLRLGASVGRSSRLSVARLVHPERR